MRQRTAKTRNERQVAARKGVIKVVRGVRRKRGQAKRPSRSYGRPSKPLTKRQKHALERVLAAFNRYRRGLSKTAAAAARAEGTTVQTMRRLAPAGLYTDRKGRLRIKVSDPYSQLVEIVTDTGPEVVTARGSRERELAGRHRSVYMRVLAHGLPPAALEEFRGQKVGGRELISDPDKLFRLARGGELDQLDALYVSPGVR